MCRLALALLIASFLCAQDSQPPTPRPIKPTQENQDQSAPKQTEPPPDQKATQEFSLLVDKVRAEIARRVQEQATANNKQKAPVDWWAFGNTGLNTLFTGLLVLLMFHQWRVMGKALTETKNATEAAKRSADAAELSMRIAYRAELLLESVVIQDHVTHEITPIVGGSKVAMNFKNWGASRANNVVFRMGLEVPGITSDDAPIGPFVIGPGETFSVSFHPFIKWLHETQATEIRTGKRPFRFSGTVSYDDVFGKSHTTSPAGEYDPEARQFRVIKAAAD